MTFFYFTCIVIALAYLFWSIYIYSGFTALSPGKTNLKTFISIIVPARNEEKNILTLLHSLASQNYHSSDFEVVIVDDHSIDSTAEKVKEFINGKDNFTLLNATAEGKKQALKTGIIHSKGELIVTVDADCTMDVSWLRAMHEHYAATGAPMLAGPVKIAEGSNLTIVLQHTEYMAMQVCGLSSLNHNKPFLCSGANLAFTRNAFNAVGGYSGNENTASGDDTFLMLKIHEHFGNIHPVIDKRAIVVSQPVKNISEYIQQYIRWGSKVKLYKNSYIKLVAALIVAGNLVFVFCFAFIFSDEWLPAHLVFWTKVLADLLILYKGVKFFGSSITVRMLPLVLFFPFLFVFKFIASVRGQYRWKGRHYNA